jgi:predicted dinucleotide-binding enzyme
MRIGILGSGDVGQTLGRGFAGVGHDVKLGTRDPKSEKVQAWVLKTGGKASSGTFAEAAAFGEVLVLATLWTGTESAIKLADPRNCAGKVVIDATNPLDFSQGMPPKLAVAGTDSGGERVQRWLPGAKVVKAFNTVGSAHMINPRFPGGPPDLFICGNDEGAKKTVSDLCQTIGWPPAVDIGGIESSRYLEPMCLTWVLYGARNNSWNHAFKLLRK